MYAKTATRFAFAAVAAMTLGGLFATARAQEVSGVEVAGRSATTIKINVAGLDIMGVRKVVRVASNDVCGAAVRNRELDEFDADWCARATLDTTMGQYRLSHGDGLREVASGTELFVVAAR
jgi:hypothetical protein